MVLLGFSFDSLTKGDINDENSGSFRCSNSSGQWDSHDSNFLSLTTMKGRKMSQFFTAVYSCIFYNTVWPNRQGKSCPARHWTGAAHSTSCRSCSKGAETAIASEILSKSISEGPGQHRHRLSVAWQEYFSQWSDAAYRSWSGMSHVAWNDDSVEEVLSILVFVLIGTALALACSKMPPGTQCRHRMFQAQKKKLKPNTL